MKWKQIPLGSLQTNCYILYKEDLSCLIVDPGEEGDKLINIIQNNNLKPVAIVITHAHFDHIGAVDAIRDKYKIPVYIHENEKDWLSTPTLNLSNFMGLGGVKIGDADVIVTKEQELTIDSFRFQLLETPGHSPGSISLFFKEDGIVLTGDALFYGSIGRTDFPGGDHGQLLQSIHEKLLVLPEETIVLSGHGPATTIGNEMDSNPFLHGF